MAEQATTARASRSLPNSKRTNGSGGLLTPDALAARWSVGRAHVYRLTREGRLPVVKLGRYYRYRLEAVEQFERGGGTAADE